MPGLRLASVLALVAVSGVGCANVDRRVAYRPYRVPRPPAATAPATGPGLSKFFPGLDRSRAADAAIPPRPDRPDRAAVAPRPEPIEEAEARPAPRFVAEADALPVALRVGLDDGVGPPPEVASAAVPRDEAARRARAVDVPEGPGRPAAPPLAEVGDEEEDEPAEAVADAPKMSRPEPGKVPEDPDAVRDALAGRPRLARFAPPTNVPPDLPPLSYPRAYYDRQPPRVMALKPKSAPAGERAPWRPRVLSRLQKRFSAPGKGGDVPKGRQVADRVVAAQGLGEPSER